jgi:hypothetical protein
MQTAVVCELDLIDRWPRTVAGILTLPAHLAACVSALKDTLANSGLWPDVALSVAIDTTRADIEWFANHRDRTHRLRDALTDEFVLSLPGASPARCVIVQQIAPGTRFIVAVPDGLTSPRVEPHAFTDTNDQSFTDRDVFLSQLFNVLCCFPGQPINVSALIANTHVLTWRTEASHTPSTDKGIQ